MPKPVNQDQSEPLSTTEVLSSNPKLAGKPVARRGRYPSIKRPPTNPPLFAEGKPERMASNELIWQGCNILSQGRDIDWKTGQEAPYYQTASKGRNAISFWLTDELHAKSPAVLEQEAALALIEQFDIRAACLHLIYAAYATQVDRPWEQHFVVDDRQLETYLGLDKNKKLNKQQKLGLLLELAKQPCHLLVYVSNAEKKGAKSFSISRTWLWEISEPILHFQENLVGDSELVGFTLQIRAGNWAKYFLNPAQVEGKSAYEYGVLSRSILQDLMSIWHGHEGAARLMLWLLFKTRVDDAPCSAGTLLRVAFGAERIAEAQRNSSTRKRIIPQWKSTLKVLHRHGWKLVFDPTTYPPQFLPDCSFDQPVSPLQPCESSKAYGGFDQLLESLVMVYPPGELLPHLSQQGSEPAQLQSDGVSIASLAFHPVPEIQSAPIEAPRLVQPVELDGARLKTLRTTKGYTQADLAQLLGKSLSWVKAAETDRRNIPHADRVRILELLD